MRKPTCTKTVIMNRAVPGSGKTTISRCMADAIIQAGLTLASHSTDEYFMRDGRYCFDAAKLNDYHLRNLQAFAADLRAGCDVVICDNTNLLPWQAEPYTRLARQFGYQLLFVNFPPRELWKHVAAQTVTPEKPDAHQVPESVLVTFIEDFHAYNALLDRPAVIDPTRHRHYIWDEATCAPVATGEPARPFDADAVLTIMPDEYQQAKATIGAKIVSLIAGIP